MSFKVRHGLDVQAYVDEATAIEAEAGGVLAAVKSLVQQPSDVWRKGSMLVSFMDDTVMVCDGVPERICALSGLCAGVPRAEPMVTMPGQLVALEVQKLPGATEPCTVLCRSRGSYWTIQVGAASCLCVVLSLYAVEVFVAWQILHNSRCGRGVQCIRAGMQLEISRPLSVCGCLHLMQLGDVWRKWRSPCNPEGQYRVVPCAEMQAEALDSGSSSSSILYGVRLPEDMPSGMTYLEVEQGPFVSGATSVLVMPPQRVMASAEVLQLLRGTPIAATGLLLGEQRAPFCRGVICCVSCALWVAYVSLLTNPEIVCGSTSGMMMIMWSMLAPLYICHGLQLCCTSHSVHAPPILHALYSWCSLHSLIGGVCAQVPSALQWHGSLLQAPSISWGFR